jgi:hypothetical protein
MDLSRLTNFYEWLGGRFDINTEKNPAENLTNLSFQGLQPKFL